MHPRVKGIKRAWRYNFDILNHASIVSEAAEDDLEVHSLDVGRYIEYAMLEGFRAGLKAGIRRARKTKPKGPSLS
jgi:hypothetical protein